MSAQIRRAVDQSGLSHYAICRATGIDKGSFSKFMAGKVGLEMANLDAVAELLRLELKPSRRAGKGR